MDNLLQQLGPSPVRRACMQGDPGVNLFPYVARHATDSLALIDFCHWTSQIVGQAMHFVGGTYAEHGVEPRDFWAFWAPIQTPGNWYAESIFTASQAEGKWHYVLSFWGRDEELHRRLAECVLHAGIGEGENYWRDLGHPESTDDDRVPVTYFAVCAPVGVLHFVSLLTAAQFD